MEVTQPETLMKRCPRSTLERLREHKGQGMTEYALILALVSVVAIATLTSLGSNIVSALNSVVSAL